MGIYIYFAEALTAAAILYSLEIRIWIWQLTQLLPVSLPSQWIALSLLSWNVIGLLFWAALYFFYCRLVQLLFKKMELPEPNRSHLIETFWQVGFLMGSSIYCLTKLILEYGITSEILQSGLLKENVFEANEFIKPCSKKYFGIFCAFYSHSIWVITSKRGFNMEAITKSLFYIFLLSTHMMRSLRAAYLAVFLLNMSTLPASLAAACCVLGRPGGRFVPRLPALRTLSQLLFSVHCLIWGVTCGWLIPRLLILPAALAKVQRPDVFTVILINAVLISFFMLHVITSPLPRLLVLLVRSAASGLWHKSPIDATLFPPQSDVMKELRRIREEVARSRRDRDAAAIRRMDQSYGKPVTACRNEPGLKLFQTIKCVMAIKRRLKRKRELQLAGTENETETTSVSPSCSCPSSDPCPTSTESNSSLESLTAVEEDSDHETD